MILNVVWNIDSAIGMAVAETNGEEPEVLSTYDPTALVNG